MPRAKCVPCLGSELKEVLKRLGDRELNQLLEKIDTCEGERELELCGKKKRASSPYNQFISTCMRQEKSLKECAREWRSKK